MRKSNRGKITGVRNNRKNRGPKINNRQPRAPMLNMRRANDFRYDVRQVVAESEINEEVGPSFIAQVIAKASRIGIKDAKIFVRDFNERGECSKNVSDNICNLLDRYTRYR